MKDPTLKFILRSFLSVVAGVSISLIIIIPFGIISALLIYSDARIPSSQEYFSYFLLIIGVSIGSFFGGFFTAKIATHFKYFFCSLTASILVFLNLLANDFDIRYYDFAEAAFLIVIIPCVFIGGRVRIKNMNPKPSDTPSSPTDTAGQ